MDTDQSQTFIEKISQNDRKLFYYQLLTLGYALLIITLLLVVSLIWVVYKENSKRSNTVINYMDNLQGVRNE
ncbi:hypothetical protein [Neodiprion sertifer nucleopolyhedrovirus]|uniref:Uncharacterized protein n=1 Tax=Neodiprion sertifer nucleopolyhedrovirus TaxID=111874 RepID=Q6JK89_9CBAC|nr:hypothetical protein NeseNPV_gp71 [Neodiprion sertifer nucleopolyhedrovirus]AAQ96448.1 hypothetical protein [Neodiprion sertifer nucleopolyhedrovirus]